MHLDRVTITGADDSIEPEALVAITEKYPFVEWGILFSGSRQGGPRYPSDTWISKLMPMGMTNRLPKLCAHLCGQWVRDVVLGGKATWWEKYRGYSAIFRRVQLNFHGQFHKAGIGFPGLVKSLDHDFILQHDGVNDETILRLGADLRVSPLFDRSGGAGVLPASWPKPIWKYQGYAGGLSPENIQDELHRILDAVGESRIWIDVETRVRSEDDEQFDLAKVDLFLKRCQPFVRA